MVASIILMRLMRFSGLEKMNMALTIISVIPSLFFMGFLFQYADPHIWTEVCSMILYLSSLN